ncbi:MAG: LytR C-terminal domain-containing protein [Acidimicrobiales bacterium]
MSRRFPGAGGGAGPSGESTRTFRAAVIVVAAVAVTVALLTQIGPGRRGTSTASGSGNGSSTTTTTAPSTTTTTTPPVAPTSVRLQVLNGLLNGSLSSQWSAKLHASPGYQTLAPDNTTARDTTSAIYVIHPGYLAEAEALARTVGLPTSAIVTTVPSSAPIPSLDLKDADLVLVIGQNLAAQA